MASSRYPRDSVLVPDHIIRLAGEFPGTVFANLRPGQQTPDPNMSAVEKLIEQQGRANMVYRPLREFLRTGVTAGDRLLMLFQSVWSRPATDIIGTACVQIERIFWTNSIDDCPRLDFARPHGHPDIFPGPNFWGPFILALMKAPQDAELFVQEEPIKEQGDGSEFVFPCPTFVELVRRYVGG